MEVSVEQDLKKTHTFWAKKQFPFFLADPCFRGPFWRRLAGSEVGGSRNAWGAFGEPWEATAVGGTPPRTRVRVFHAPASG